jgi:HlyD family secretion protein
MLLGLGACKKKAESVKPQFEDITESVYASGVIKSENQYQVFSTVNGILNEVHVTEGDQVGKNALLFSIFNQISALNRENANLNAEFSDLGNNQSKIQDLKISIELANKKMEEDSLLFVRQTNLWKQEVGSKLELEQRKLAYLNSATTFKSAKLKLKDLERQLSFSSKQSKNNLAISKQLESDYSIVSKYEGKVYSIFKEKGELVNTQTPLAIIGDAKNFTLELQVDEYDIASIKLGIQVFITLDSYRDSVFEAFVSKIYPIMNERSKTFTIEARFVKQPPSLFPNLTVEANIVLQKKQKVLCIPRKYLINDKYVLNTEGKQIEVKTGLKDYAKVEILSGISETDELTLPIE